MRGWIQGYNAQAACKEQHLILAAEVMTASPDFGHLGPIMTAARTELAAAGVTQAPRVVVADAGYWHLEQINELTGQGIASAVVNTCQQVGGAVGTAVLSTIFATAASSYASSHAPSPGLAASAAVHGYTTAFYCATILFAIGFLVAALVLPRRIQPQQQLGGEPAADIA